VNVIEGRFDRRATHRIFSEPVALDLVNDLTALASEGIRYLEAAHWLALGTGDEQLVRGINVGHDRLVAIREITHRAAALVEDSIRIDPYIAVEAAA
jgi:hypothetical protein